MHAGMLLPSWSSCRDTEALHGLANTQVSTTSDLRVIDDEQPKDIQAAVDASEDMQLAIQDFGLTSDLYMVIGVSDFSPSIAIADHKLTAFQNPFVALVYPRVEYKAPCYLKLLRPDRTGEAGILSYLAKIDCPDNHAIWPIASRVCENGTLLLLPHAGVSLRDHEAGLLDLVSFAGQFLRGVAFLHEHKVAHCDLKTANVVMDRDTGRVTLIDFDLAVRGLDWLDGFTGTNGWTAPEVGEVARYNPMKADVWSAGKVLRTTAWKCPESADRAFLLELSDRMMAKDPNARPSMKTVVESFDRYVESRAESVFPSATTLALESNL